MAIVDIQHHTGYGHPADAAAIPVGRIYHTILQPGRYHAAIPVAGGICPVLCDMVTYTAAKEMDVNAFLITSSAESIRAAFDQAVFLQRQPPAGSENQFLRQAPAPDQYSPRTGKLVSRWTPPGKYSPVLRENRERGCRGTHQGHAAVPRLLYNIEAMQLPSDGGLYRLLFFSLPHPCRRDKYGISYYNCSQLEEACSAGIYNITGLTAQYHQSILQAAAGRAPVFLFGAAGTGRKVWRARSTCAARRSHPLFRSTVTY